MAFFFWISHIVHALKLRQNNTRHCLLNFSLFLSFVSGEPFRRPRHQGEITVLCHLTAAKEIKIFLSLRELFLCSQDQRRRGIITASECRTFIRALFCYGPKLGVPVTLVVPYGSAIHRQMWSQPGKIIVSCGKDINEVIEVKPINEIEINLFNQFRL